VLSRKDLHKVKNKEATTLLKLKVFWIFTNKAEEKVYNRRTCEGTRTRKTEV